MTGNVTRYGKGVRNVTNMNRHALVFIYKQEHYDTRFSFANRNTDFSFIKKKQSKKTRIIFHLLLPSVFIENVLSVGFCFHSLFTGYKAHQFHSVCSNRERSATHLENDISVKTEN